MPENTSTPFPPEDDPLATLDTHPLMLAATWINRLYLGLVFVAGVSGNALILAVQRRIRRAAAADSQLSVFICSLAVSDTCMLALTVPFWFLLSFGVNLSVLDDALCKVVYWYLYFVGRVSSWLLVAMTVYRAASILWPHGVGRSVSAVRAKVVVLVLVCGAMLTDCHLLYGLSLQRLDSGQLVCGFVSYQYYQFYSAAFLWLDIVAGSLVPFSLLALSNGVIVRTVGKAAKVARYSLSAGTHTQLRQRQRKAAAMNVTLVCVSVTYVALTSPLCVILIDKHVRGAVFAGDVDTAAWNFFLETLTNALWLTNNAINFYIYTLTGGRYRQEVAAMLGCARRDTAVTSTAVTST